MRATQGGILFSDVELGDRVRRGDVLGTVTDPITNAHHDIVAPEDGRVLGMALNQVMYPGYAAYHIGLQATAQGVVDESEPEEDEFDGEMEVSSGDEINIDTVDDPNHSESQEGVLKTGESELNAPATVKRTESMDAPYDEPYDGLEDSE